MLYMKDRKIDISILLYQFIFRIPDLEAEQTESLIGIDSGDHEA